MTNFYFGGNYSAALDALGVNFTSDSTSGYSPLSVNFLNTSIADNIVSWLWNFGDGTNSTGFDSSHVYGPGTFSVSLSGTTTDSSVITKLRTDYISVYTSIVADFTAVQSIIDDDIFDFQDLSTGSPDTWLWDFGDSTTSSLQNPTHHYGSAGYYTVSLTASAGPSSDTVVKPNYIFVDLDADFSADTTAGIVDMTVNFTDLSQGSPTSWVWDFGDGNISTAQNPLHIYHAPGVYTVVLTSFKGALQDTRTRTNYITVGSALPQYYWISAAPSVSDSTSNWSHYSGGIPTTTLPGPSDTVYFDASGLGDCFFNNRVNYNNLYVQSDYTGTIQQLTGNSITINQDASFCGGVFQGSDASISVYGKLFIDIDFSSTRDFLNVYGDFSCTQFYHNDGTCKFFTTDSLFKANGAYFNDLMFDNNQTPPGYRLIDTTSTVDNNLILNGGSLKRGADGTVNVFGDIFCNAQSGEYSNNHNAVIRMTAGRPQNIISQGGIISYLLIDKTTSNHVVLLGDTVKINGDFIIEDGTVNSHGQDILIGNITGI